MTVDYIIHPAKDFGNIGDGDVTNFLRDRKFESERSILEFKAAFPVDGGGSDARQICKLIVGFLNAEGGVIVFGVSDRINDATISFPEYVPGLAEYPNQDRLSQLTEECISPPVDMPPMRVFDVEGRKVAILKVPPGDNKPYCYYDPRSHAVWYFMRSGNRVVELAPDEIRESYRASFAKQVDRFLRDGEANGDVRASRMAAWGSRVKAHQKWAKSKLEDPQNFGFFGMYTLPMRRVEIPWQNLSEFLKRHRNDFSSELQLAGQPEPYQKCVSVGYFPRAIREDIKSTYRVTLFTNGLVALDSQVDHFMDRASRGLGKILHPFWFSYQLQRYLQLSRAVLEPWNIDLVDLIVQFENIEDFSMGFQRDSSGVVAIPYSGPASPIERELRLSEAYAYDGDERNIAMPIVKDIMAEVCRIFGSAYPPALWDENGYLNYVKGLEGTR
jgi:hypothetical protein